MNKATLAVKIAEKMRINKKQAEEFIEVFEVNITNALKAGEEVTIAGFGTFSARRRHSRMGVNPRKPSESMRIPEVVVPKFKAGKALKESLKGKR